MSASVIPEWWEREGGREEGGRREEGGGRREGEEGKREMRIEQVRIMHGGRGRESDGNYIEIF